ncbi:Trehalose utilization [Polystyrenella longa]|uniref:Trehalose utilization n=1 Tax=Polystyrenella longa TaxID=2528007 RepID=A0A518CJI0_9PLAN|nr:ThuA domain-containing protein [Polystyrenella longa]QDU79370.1 Trehalose utilization [Polystyrenella longa]
MMRKFLLQSLGSLAVLLIVGGLSFTQTSQAMAAQKQPHIVFVTGDHEYRSEITMPMIAKLLEKNYGFKTTVLYAINKQTGKIDVQEEENIPGLEVLKDADLAVVFLRWRRLPENQLKMLVDYAQSGKPMVGLRTSTHPLNYPEGHPLQKWNSDFPTKFFGQKWITHHGHDASTDVHPILSQTTNPILSGIRPFHARSWLYHVTPLEGECTPLLEGTAYDSNKVGNEKEYPLTQPVAWTKNNNGGKVFFTTLGHPQDFEIDSMRRVLVNGIFWGLGKEIPSEGTNVDLEEPFIAPESNEL